MSSFVFADQALSLRLERAEASANCAYVESRARWAPERAATWIDVEGTWAMFDGVGSPCTQTFGFGLFSVPRAEQLDILEEFFFSRGSDVHHEVSPLADPSTLTILGDRGYRPIELTTVLHRPIDASSPGSAASDVHVRPIAPSETRDWADASAKGWGEQPELGDFMRDMGVIMTSSRNVTGFVAEIDGVIAATGALAMHDGVAMLAGASTIPEFRGRGAQNALLQARLRMAAAQGCDLAAMGASPGSASQRNAERQGFRVAYTRTKWARK